MSLLTIIQGACDRLTLVRPTTVIGNTDQTTLDLLGFAQQEGKELARRGSWQVLTSEKTFTTSAAETQASAVPTDFDWYLSDTMFNRTTRRQFAEPMSSEEWQRMKASLITCVNPAFRFRGNSILISPTPAAGNTVAYEYMSKNWCQSAGSVGQSVWTADTDTALIDEEFHILGLVWRFRKSKGLDYAEDFSSYELNVMQALQRDGAKPRISGSPGRGERIPHAPQIPDGMVFS